MWVKKLPYIYSVVILFLAITFGYHISGLMFAWLGWFGAIIGWSLSLVVGFCVGYSISWMFDYCYRVDEPVAGRMCCKCGSIHPGTCEY